MEAEKLYYADCHLKEFSATVTGCEETAGGFRVTLDATAFYPEGGGQPCDLGSLGTARVLDVREMDGNIVHLCDAPLAVGSAVTGKIDWERRFDLMQQHTGEHIVSGIIHKLFGAHNVGFHMGADTVTIDFDTPVPAEMLPQIEAEANRAVYENLPVSCTYPPEDALPAIPYRSKKQLPWPVRIVEVPGYDICACCGVHVAATGEIGLIKLLSCMKFHQGVRIEMVCASRAFSYLSRIYEQNRLVCQAFSAKPLETGAAAQRMNEALAAEKLRSAGLERRIFDTVAEAHRNAGDVVIFEEGLASAAVRELADRVADTCGGVAAVFSGSDEEGYSLCLVSRSGDVKALGQALAAACKGKGGGKPGFFQGSVRATRREIEEFFSN